MQEVKLFNHGLVRLVDSMGDDLSIVRAARVSYDAAWRSGSDQGSDARLIKRLLKDHHTSPFEAVEFQFEVVAPIFVLRQWHRHRTWSYNELSARYKEIPQEFYIPAAHTIGSQATDNKQGRVIGKEWTGADGEALSKYIATCIDAGRLYSELLQLGWPRELARAVLPVATYSHMFAKVDLHNLFHFLHLRLNPHAQYEIRQYAQALLTLIEAVVPVTVAAWRELNEV